MHFITAVCTKQLQVLISGFLNNIEFYHLKKPQILTNKTQGKPLDMFINFYVSVAIVGFPILISVLTYTTSHPLVKDVA